MEIEYHVFSGKLGYGDDTEISHSVARGFVTNDKPHPTPPNCGKKKLPAPTACSIVEHLTEHRNRF